MDKDIKKVLIYLCIIIIIIIILRFLYLRLKNKYVNYMGNSNGNNNTIENFDANIQSGDAIDLLTKTKSHTIIESSSSNFGAVNIVKPWTTKLYNMENRKTKAISLYQPNLFINNSFVSILEKLLQPLG